MSILRGLDLKVCVERKEFQSTHGDRVNESTYCKFQDSDG
ncbi:unnamed protein product [Brassica oleracea var. botrytis]